MQREQYNLFSRPLNLCLQTQINDAELKNMRQDAACRAPTWIHGLSRGTSCGALSRNSLSEDQFHSKLQLP